MLTAADRGQPGTEPPLKPPRREDTIRMYRHGEAGSRTLPATTHEGRRR